MWVITVIFTCCQLTLTLVKSFIYWHIWWLTYLTHLEWSGSLINRTLCVFYIWIVNSMSKHKHTGCNDVVVKCVVCALQPGLQHVPIRPHALKRNFSSVKWLQIDSGCKGDHTKKSLLSLFLYNTFFLLYFILLLKKKYRNLSDRAGENDESREHTVVLTWPTFWIV